MNTTQGRLILESSHKIAIIASRFNHIITDRLVEGARDTFVRHGGEDKNLDLFIVPGAFELPFVLKKLLKTNKYDGICTLGAIIRGGTPHFDYVSAECIKGVANTMLQFETPVTFGVLTTNTVDEAIERAGSKAGNKGAEAMIGLIELINLYVN